MQRHLGDLADADTGEPDVVALLDRARIRHVGPVFGGVQIDHRDRTDDTENDREHRETDQPHCRSEKSGPFPLFFFLIRPGTV